MGSGTAGGTHETSDANRLALLLHVSDVLSLTSDPDEAVGQLARLIVPQLAD